MGHDLKRPSASSAVPTAATYQPNKCQIAICFRSRGTSLIAAFLSYCVALFSGSILCATSRADAAFDKVFSDLAEGLVLQVNSKDEPGTPVFKARLFGTSTITGAVTLRFRRSGSAVILLNGQELPQETAPPAAPGQFLTETAKMMENGTEHLWSWEGIFIAPANLNFSKDTIWIELSDPTNHPQVLRAHLGDVWFAAGGDNVRRSWPATGVTEPGFALSPKQPGSPADLTVLTYTPQAAQPMNWSLGAPQLATHVAVVFAQEFKRPQMIVTIARPKSRMQDWKDAKASNLIPLSGTGGQFKIGLGVRGAIWWTGEVVADAAPPEDLLPGELSPDALHMAFRQWQDKQTEEIKAAMKHLADLLGLGDRSSETNLSPAETTFDPNVGKLTFLIVQAPGVWRQPPSFGNMSFTPVPWSSWELLRAAQSDAARDWRDVAMRKVIFGNATAPVVENIGFRAFLVATLPGKDQMAFAKPRWQWDDPAHDDARYAALAVRLTDAAKRARRWTDAGAAANIAFVDWTDKKKAVVNIPGAKGFDTTGAGEPPLEYLTAESPSKGWKTASIWTAPQQTIGQANETVIAVRYSPGDAGGPLRTLLDADGHTAGLLPAFTAYRDTVTKVP